jgi:hypothetical protein
MYPDLGPTYHFNADPDLILFDADLDTDFLFYADPDPTFHPDADPDSDLDPSFQIKAQTLGKVLKNGRIPYILLVICKWMQIRIRIQPIALMRIRILILFNADPDAVPGSQIINPDPDPQNWQKEGTSAVPW